jgi:WD40 repeat protein
MRLIDLDAGEVRTVAVSPDGRYLAASGVSGWMSVFDWATGEPIRRLRLGVVCDQFAFGPEGWLAYVHNATLLIDRLDPNVPPSEMGGGFAGGVAVAPDGRALVAARAGPPRESKIDKWGLPGLRRQLGFDYCSPYRRMVFSSNGTYLGGIWPGLLRRNRSEPAHFDIRYGPSGGLDKRFPPTGERGAFNAGGFVSFSHDSGTCVFGWENEFHVLDTSTGTARYVRRVEALYRAAAFTGSGRLFATVEETGYLKFWDPTSWTVVREYDWGCGPLTSLAFTADGSAGVCGTAGGQLVQFDVDE